MRAGRAERRPRGVTRQRNQGDAVVWDFYRLCRATTGLLALTLFAPTAARAADDPPKADKPRDAEKGTKVEKADKPRDADKADKPRDADKADKPRDTDKADAP